MSGRVVETRPSHAEPKKPLAADLTGLPDGPLLRRVRSPAGEDAGRAQTVETAHKEAMRRRAHSYALGRTGPEVDESIRTGVMASPALGA